MPATRAAKMLATGTTGQEGHNAGQNGCHVTGREGRYAAGRDWDCHVTGQEGQNGHYVTGRVGR